MSHTLLSERELIGLVHQRSSTINTWKPTWRRAKLNYLKKFLKILPGESLLSMVDGLVGLVGVGGSSGFSVTTTGVSVEALAFFFALAMTVEFVIALRNVSDGEL